MTRDLRKALDQIGNDKDIIDPKLMADLSDLNSRELSEFQAAWQGWTPLRKQELLLTMIEEAMEHIEYNFRVIFNETLRDEDPAVRALSIEGLWEDERPHLVPLFCKMLMEDEAAEVRAAAAGALGRFIYLGEVGALDSTIGSQAFEALWERFHRTDETVEVRSQALESIGASSEPQVNRIIESAFYSDELEMRVSALKAMGRNADPRWIPFLVPELRHEEKDLRLAALASLAELEARPAVPHIIQMMEGERNEDVIRAALKALGLIGGDEARKALEAAMEWEDEAMVDVAEEALDILLASDGNTFEYINEVLGLEEEFDGLSPDDDFYEDPLEAEIRQLLDDRDGWL
ncbi:MAG: HEAT repeat domain-containing protein [Caldilineae bacterium]|nr:MAG: HEAT repeat domain-containing protein [Caldilineae bacterium]